MSLPSSIQQVYEYETSLSVTEKFKYRIIFQKGSLSYNGGYYSVVLQGKYYNSSDTTAKLNCTMNYKLSTSFGSWGSPISYQFATSDSDFVEFETLTQGNYNDTTNDNYWTNFPIRDRQEATVYISAVTTAIISIGTRINHSVSIRPIGTEQIFTNEANPSATFLTFPPAPYIQNPINVNPNLTTVSRDGNVDFSFQFMGEKLEAYKINVYRTDGEFCWTSNLQHLDHVRYNGEIITTTVPMNTVYQARKSTKYYWEILMYDTWDTNIETTEENYVPFNSLRYYFETYMNPTLTVQCNGTEVDSSYTLNKKNLSLVGQYNQSQNIPIKWYEIILSQNGNIILDTDKIFSADIKLDYDGFITDRTYKVEIVAENIKQQQISKSIIIAVSYTQQYNNFQNAKCIIDDENQLIKVQWDKENYAIGKPEGYNWNYVLSKVQSSTGKTYTSDESIVIYAGNEMWYLMAHSVSATRESFLGGSILSIAGCSSTIAETDIEDYVYENGNETIHGIKVLCGDGTFALYVTEAVNISTIQVGDLLSYLKSEGASYVTSLTLLSKTNKSVEIDTQTLSYDSRTNKALTIPSEDFSVVFRTTISQDTQGTICEFTTEIGKDYYNIYITGYTIMLRYQKNGVLGDKVLGNVFEHIEYGVKNSSEPAANTGYIWTENSTDIWTNTASNYFVVNAGFEATFLIYISTQKEDQILRAGALLVT